MSRRDPIDSYHHDAGKGHAPRPCDQQRYAENYDRIFGGKNPGKEQEHASKSSSDHKRGS
jgi:hypothetical protein